MTFPWQNTKEKITYKKTAHEKLFSIRCRKNPMQLTTERSSSSSRDQIQNRAIRDDKKDFSHRSNLEQAG